MKPLNAEASVQYDMAFDPVNLRRMIFGLAKLVRRAKSANGKEIVRNEKSGKELVDGLVQFM